MAGLILLAALVDLLITLSAGLLRLRLVLGATLLGLPWSPAAVQRTRLALRRAAIPKARPSRVWWPKLATAMPVAIVLMAIGTMAALAAPSALPDSRLYAVRNVRETLEIELARTPGRRASLYVSFARQRADQLRGVTRAKGTSPLVISTLLRDLSSRIRSADAEARDASAGTRDAIRNVEGQIDTELIQIQGSELLSPDASRQLDTTIHDIQSGESNSPEPTVTTPSSNEVP